MKIIRSVLRSASIGSSRHFQRPQVIRTFSASPFPGSDGNRNSNPSESTEDFEQRIFGDMSSTPSLGSFYQKLDKAERASHSGFSSTFSFGNRSSLDGLDESFNTLSDGMDEKLKKAATYFDYDPEEISKDNYTYRPDMNFWSGNTYDVKDLDLNKPGIRKPFKRNEFETTSEEVLRKADFRNVRFLANFITEAGIIIKRSKTGISAKAQRKVAREIKTARAFGLIPFTTMGTKQFIYGKTMENQDEDYAYEAYEPNFVEDDVEI